MTLVVSAILPAIKKNLWIISNLIKVRSNVLLSFFHAALNYRNAQNEVGAMLRKYVDNGEVCLIECTCYRRKKILQGQFVYKNHNSC